MEVEKKTIFEPQTSNKKSEKFGEMLGFEPLPSALEPFCATRCCKGISDNLQISAKTETCMARQKLEPAPTA